MEKYRNTYRILSARLPQWDYSAEAAYFITVCTQNKEHYFGKIINSTMHKSPIGTIAEEEWLKTPSVRPDMNIMLGEFVFMPNHFHGVVVIGENEYNQDIVSINSYGPQRKNLSSIIRGFKSSVTTYARKNNLQFNWQERFHDHVIRSDEEHIRIEDYIMMNVINWKEDGYY